MGYNEERFVEPVGEEFKCLICSEVLEDPMECRQCQTNFCKMCIDSWMKKSAECPNRCKLELLPSHKGFKSLLLHLKLRCAIAGCPEIVTIGTVAKHENEECLFRVIACKNSGCQETVQVKDMPHHNELCPFASLQCDACMTFFLRKDVTLHNCLQALLSEVKAVASAHEELKNQVQSLSHHKNQVPEPESSIEEDDQVHQGISCNGCNAPSIKGVRYMCRKCISFDLCETCRSNILHGHNDYWEIPAHLKHEGIRCDGCGVRPIVGPRYKCVQCSDFDFCHGCKMTVAHPHNEFTAFLPYWAAVIPLAEERVAYHFGETFTRSWMLVNLGSEVIVHPIMNLLQGEPGCTSYAGIETSLPFDCVLQHNESFLLQHTSQVTQRVPGTYSSEWGLSTSQRVSFFGPKLVYQLTILG